MIPLRFALLVIIWLAFALTARAQFPTTQPYPSTTYTHEQRKNPEMSLHVVTIDLWDPDVAVRLAMAGDDPDGDGPWQTTLLPVSRIAQRERFDIAVNASFYEIIGGTTNYRPDVWASSVGWTMSDGRFLSRNRREGWPIFCLAENKRIRIGITDQFPREVRVIITGNGLLLQGGKQVEKFEGNLIPRHPRTALGVDQTNQRLTILIVDGRRPGVSVGMTGAELATEMQRLGCWDAINLDGGGSTTLLMRDPKTDELKLLNQPSGDAERAVANALGITIKRQTTRSAPGANLSNN